MKMSNTTKMTDSVIQQAILRELKWDTRVEATDIGVAVNGGVVTLTGAVSSWGKRLAAQDAAHRVAHVLDVANDLEVRLPGTIQKTDTEIAKAVRQALEWDVFVPDARIRSTVSHGGVTLEGDVDCSTEREDAGRAIRNLAGVVGVINRIEIKPPKASTLEVRDHIEHALARQAQREATRIELEVRDATVTVSGRVHSWAEREAVLGAAKGTRGVEKVESHLRIEPYAG
jgi:osmotically-inducible protein OsmY